MNSYDLLSGFDEDELLDEEDFMDDNQKVGGLEEIENEALEEFDEDLL